MPTGDLVVRAGAAELREQAPTAYQESDGIRRPIEASYRILGNNTVAFDLGDYDVTRPLVIDPVISYSTYLGGTAQSAVTALAVDASGNLYAAGWTEAIDFPVSNAIQAVNRGGVDAFVFKLNAAGNTLLYATYIGGRGDDRAAGIAVDSSGQIYLAGSTASTDFPLVSSIRPALGGTRDAFVVKLNAIGNLLLYSTYLGGSGYDAATAIAVDSAGNAYIAGDTQSTDFPLSSPVQAVFGGKTDAFVTKLTSAGAISFSTYLGGTNDEHAGGVAVDGSGNIYLAGGTLSTNFPLAAPLQADERRQPGRLRREDFHQPGIAGLQHLFGRLGRTSRLSRASQRHRRRFDGRGLRRRSHELGQFSGDRGSVPNQLQRSSGRVRDQAERGGKRQSVQHLSRKLQLRLGQRHRHRFHRQRVCGRLYFLRWIPRGERRSSRIQRVLRRLRLQAQPPGQRAHVFHDVRRHRRRSGQCHRRRYFRKHVRRRPDQLVRSALAGRDPVVQRRRQHRMGRAARRDGPAAAGSRRELGFAVLRERQHSNVHGSILASGGGRQPDHGRTAAEHHGLSQLRLLRHL